MSSEVPVTVGVDGSETALTALDWAVEYAQVRHLPLRILNSVEMPPPMAGYVPYPLTELRSEAEKESRNLLSSARERLQTSVPELRVETVVSLQPPIPTLLTAAKDSALVVVGCRGLNPLQSVLLGSVSTAISAHAACPVAVIRSDRRPDADAPIVVGIAGSDRDPETVAAAFDAAAASNAPLTVVHAWSDLILAAPFGGASGDWVTWDDLRTAAAESVERRLAEWTAKYPTVPVATRIVRDDPGGALLEAGKTAGLLVVGSHGRGGFAGMRLGSVASRLVHHADCPVLVVRHPGRPITTEEEARALSTS